MNWRIEEAEVRFVAAGNRSLGSIHAFPEQKVLYRSDTKAPLSVVSARYQIVQPAEILESYRDLTEVGGFQLETAGVLKEGRKLWALARTGQSATLKGKDEVNGYLLLATACDGTLATTAQFTSVRVVCNNTLQIALGDSDSAVKVPRRSQFDAQAVRGLTVRRHTSTVADCCDANSLGDGLHLQIHRSSLKAVRRLSGPFIDSRGPSRAVFPVELHAGQDTSSPSCATYPPLKRNEVFFA